MQNDALHRAVLAASSEGGPVFERLATELASILEVAVAFVAVFAGAGRSHMRMVALSLDGRIRAPFTYALEGTPCARVVGRQFHCVPANARDEFPSDDLFNKLGLDSYAAYPLNDARGEPLGLIGAMHRAPLARMELCEPILKIFALRAAAEIERGRVESERARSEASAGEALRASESRYRAIFNAAADSMVLRDADFRVVDVNPAYETMSGRRREEALGRNELTMSPPELTAHVRGLHAQALAGKAVMFEARARRKNGETFDIETRGVPIQHQGRPHVLYIGRDITSRKSAEQALRASEAQYRAIFNAAADALVLRDAGFRIVDVNPAYVALSGYSREEVIGRDHLVANPPETEGTLRELHARALAGETISLETVRVRKDGRRHEVELRGVPIRHHGEPHVLYIGRDISERRALESRLRQAQKMEALGQLTGGVAHDFNNLLASIMGYVVLGLEKNEGGDPKVSAHLEQALASCRRARDLVRQMLTFSRGQRGKLRPLPLAGTIDQSLALLRGTLPSTLEVETAIDPAPAVLHDPLHLEQVLMNLLINARDATSGIGRVEVRLRPAALSSKAVCSSCRKRFRGDFVELAVADSGGGIAPHVLERVFEPFFTTKEVGRGSGMGLAMVHGIVHEHGGHVVVESEPGKGSRFRILLPPVEGAAEAVPEARPAAPARRARLSGRVLVVDDEESVGGFMRELLQSWGLDATALASPLGVIERVSREPAAYDLVILDQTMPGITGMNLAREIVAVRPGLPVILYTGHSDRIRPEDLDAAGVRALIHKPVEPDLLHGLLEKHLLA